MSALVFFLWRHIQRRRPAKSATPQAQTSQCMEPQAYHALLNEASGESEKPMKELPGSGGREEMNKGQQLFEAEADDTRGELPGPNEGRRYELGDI